MKFEEFKNLDVWKQASVVSSVVFEITEKKHGREVNELMQLIKKLASGLLSSVTQACSTDANADKLRFLNLSKAKLLELEQALERVHESGLVSFAKLKRSLKHIQKMRMLLVSYISYHQRLAQLEEPRLKYAG